MGSKDIALDLLEKYQGSERTVIENHAHDMAGELKCLKIECEEYRTKIMDLTDK